ncbi:MAG: hypothetical protein E7410_04570 [Ruminococcaceae bacterium]|nr:hypothetical protein [Oscillospiraceae bacterium]
MSKDMDKAIDALKEMLDSPDGAKTIESLVSAFMSGDSKNTPQNPKDDDEDENDAPVLSALSDIPVDSIMKIAGAYKSLNKTSDPRINLLKAIKPYVRSTRSESVDTAIKLLGLLRLAPLLGELKDVL